MLGQVFPQFNPKQCKNELLRYPYIESFEDVDEVIQVAKDTNAIIVYTLIKPEMKQYMSEKVAEFQLKSVDIMGPLMDLLSASVEEKPIMSQVLFIDWMMHISRKLMR